MRNGKNSPSRSRISEIKLKTGIEIEVGIEVEIEIEIENRKRGLKRELKLGTGNRGCPRERK